MFRSFLLHYFLIIIIILLFSFISHFQPACAISTPAGPLIKHLTSILKWTSSKSFPKSSHSGDGPVIQFESGYLVETVVEGNALGVIPHLIRVSQEGELFAVDSENSNIVRVTPPLSQYSRARLVAGSFQGKTGHVDGKPSDARFNHPKGVTMDDKGNVYVADTENLAIRKIGDGGVTTIAGGKSNVAGYRDGPSEDAKFSSDFDVVYVPSTCSLLVVDRGNAALRRISLNQEDCDANASTISASDIVMVIGAVFVGYASCLLHEGLGHTLFSKFLQPSDSDIQRQEVNEKNNIILESSKSGQIASSGWPSIRQLATDFSKLARETLTNSLDSFLPSQFAGLTSRKGLTPLKDRLKMPEDEVNPNLAQKLKTPAPFSESWQAYPASATDKNPEMKASKIRSTSIKDPSLPSKHRSSKRQEYAEFYGTSETPLHVGQTRSKSQKERSKHRHHRDKSGEVVMPGANTVESKPSVAMNYMDPKFDPYNVRNRYMPDGSYRYY